MIKPTDLQSIKNDIATVFQSCTNSKDVEYTKAAFINHISLFRQYRLIDEIQETCLIHHVNVWAERVKYQFNYWGKS